MNIPFGVIGTELDAGNNIYAPSRIEPVLVKLANTVNRVMIGYTQIVETDFLRCRNEFFGGLRAVRKIRMGVQVAGHLTYLRDFNNVRLYGFKNFCKSALAG